MSREALQRARGVGLRGVLPSPSANSKRLLNAFEIPLLSLRILDEALGCVAQGADITDPIEPSEGPSVASSFALFRKRLDKPAAIVLDPLTERLDPLRSVRLSAERAAAVAAEGELLL
ncbi:MAG TPA: hypothetical protein VKD28_10220 [Gemmatimonadales bacterium]|nr:hypothetical protein [Gemmatimonadales bacterium]